MNLNLITIKDKIYTKSTDNLKWYGEEVIKKENYYLREWSPFSSKISAAIKKGYNLPDLKNTNILYLGCSSGTTVSHLSDLSPKIIVGVDISSQSMLSFLELSKKRNNIYPLMFDAFRIDECDLLKNTKFEYIFQDVSQKNMIAIFINAFKNFANKDSFGAISLKTNSIDTTKKPKEVLDISLKELQKEKINVLKVIDLNPFEKNHYFIIIRGFK